MTSIVAGSTSEVSRVISAVSIEYFAHAAPPGMADRLTRLHERAWDTVMAGGSSAHIFTDLRREADRLFNAQDVIDNANHHVMWALTPVIAASLACEPGGDSVSLREIGAALRRLLEVSLAGADVATSEPARAAA